MNSETTLSAQNERSSAAPPQPEGIPGSWVVIGMFGFAVIMTAVLWIYSYLHAAPFQPLTRAIAQEFEDSAPHVEGGQQKIHESTPNILRIIMRVEFNPETETPEVQQRIDEIVHRLTELAQIHTDFETFDQLEVHFYSLEPEKAIRERTITREVSELQRVVN